MEQLKSKKGITLIALVITIIVLIILAGVSINLVLGDKGIITISKDAKENTQLAEEEEKNKLNKLYLELEEATGGSEAGTKETIPTQEDEVKTASGNAKGYVGYYADLNNDGKITLEDDGIIYADLAVGASGLWNDDEESNYSYEAITSGLKQYYISSATTEVDPLKTGKGIIREVEGTSGTDRFYVMALEDVNGTRKDGTTTNYFRWYAAAYDSGISDYATVTSTSFGKGKENTSTMITKWKETAYGAQNSNETFPDMWGVIEDKVEEGWFVPSKEEWSAFGYNLGITTDNYTNEGLSAYCWSSSLSSSDTAWLAICSGGCMDVTSLSMAISYVRLSATF